MAIGFVLVVWLYFLSKAFPGRRAETVGRLRGVINPEKAGRRERQKLIDAIDSGSLIGYEIAGWKGESSIGGWGGWPDPRSLTIQHGDPSTESEWVEVTTHTGVGAETADDWLEDHLARRLLYLRAPAPKDLATGNLDRWRRQREGDIREAEPLAWQPLSTPIDDEPTQGKMAAAGDYWVAHFKAASVVVYLVGQGFDPSQISLGRIANFDPYT